MKSVFEKIAKYALISGILNILFGGLVLVMPALMMQSVVYILATYAIIMGIVRIVAHFRDRQQGNISFSFVSGSLYSITGIVMLIFTKAILSILPVFLGIFLILGGVIRLAEVFGATAGGWQRITLILMAVMLMIGGFIIVANPFTSALFLFQVFGILVIVQGTGEVLSFFSFKRVGKQSKE